MADFNFNTFTTTAQSLLNGEFGFVGQSGGVSTDGAAAVTGTGTFEVTAMGSIAANGADAITGTGAFTVSLLVGTSGSITSADNDAVEMTVSNTFIAQNAGVMMGRESALDIDATGSASIFIDNSGVMSSRTLATASLSVAAGFVEIVNSGTMSTTGFVEALFVTATSSAQIEITNTGTIATTSLGVAAININSGGLTVISNSGTIMGGVVTGSGGQVILTNTGLIDGDITLSSGADIITLRGGTVTGTVAGGDGSDAYVIDDASIIIVETAPNGDLDAINTTVSYAAGTGIERILLVGSDDIDGWITSGANSTMIGNSGDNRLFGGAGVDNIAGGLGADTLSGKANDDQYFVDADDTVIEAAGGGEDTISFELGVTALASYTMAANVENLFMTVAISLVTGNSGDNSINQFDNTNTTMNGAGGTDTFSGGNGNNTYITDGGDTIIESGGIDTVQSSVSFTLATGLENLVLKGSSFTGTGNSGANAITGHSGNNTLNGAGGTDAMAGGGGNDLYITDGGDTLTEGSGAGTDTVQSSVSHTLLTNFENLVLTGSAAINGTGNSANNAITGNGAANSLNGLLGNDTMAGGAGNDAFIFNTTLGSTNVDRITDFNAPNDTILLENAVFTALTTGTLKSGAFARNTTGNAGDASDRIIYETDTGKLFYDSDGAGGTAKVHFATLNTNITLTNSDFVVI